MAIDNNHHIKISMPVPKTIPASLWVIERTEVICGL